MSLVRASGVGSWPGESAEAIKVVAQLLGENDLGIPYIPEMPGRGPGADMIGRAGAFLQEMSIDLQPSGWRLLNTGKGRDLRRGESYLMQDVDQVAEVYADYAGALKTQVCGPLTLAASLWLPRGERVLSDHGATRDIAQSLAAGVREHLTTIQRFVPNANLVLQLDEPGISAVLAGELKTASGLGRLRPTSDGVARELLSEVFSVATEFNAETLVHTCAPGAPIELLQRAGADGISLDVSLLTTAQYDAVGALVDSGGTLWAGIVPTSGVMARHPKEITGPLTTMWNRIGFGFSEYDRLVLTPACGLAGAAPTDARSRQRLVLEAASMLNDEAA